MNYKKRAEIIRKKQTFDLKKQIAELKCHKDNLEAVNLRLHEYLRCWKDITQTRKIMSAPTKELLKRTIAHLKSQHQRFIRRPTPVKTIVRPRDRLEYFES